MWTTRYIVYNAGIFVESFDTEAEAEAKIATMRTKYTNLKLSGLYIKPCRSYVNA